MIFEALQSAVTLRLCMMLPGAYNCKICHSWYDSIDIYHALFYVKFENSLSISFFRKYQNPLQNFRAGNEKVSKKG